MNIGPYELDNPFVLAPMAGVTDKPFRLLCKKHGAALCVSEMTSANALLWNSPKTLHRLDHEGEADPISVQIAGGIPEQMAQAAIFNVKHGAQIVDINMGCPAKKVCRVQAGSALLQNEFLVQKILKRVVKAVDVPVTLKIRTGWDRKNKNALNIAHIAEQEGITALTIHGRTRADKYQGDAEYDTIKAVKQAISIPVIANGDITSPQKAEQVLDYTQADAVMIGRASLGDPWIFRRLNDYLNGITHQPPENEEIIQTVSQHIQAIYDFYGEAKGIKIARKHIAWYCKDKKGSAQFRKKVNSSQTTNEQMRQIRLFFK